MEKPAVESVSKKGFILAAVLALITIVVVVMTTKSKNAAAAKQKAFDDAQRSFLDEYEGLQIHNDAEAQKVIDMAMDSTREHLWKGPLADSSILSRVESKKNQARASLEDSKHRNEVIERFSRIEEQLKNPGAITPDQVREIQRSLEEIDVIAESAGPAFAARVKEVLKTSGRLYATRLADDAKAFESANPDKARLAMVRYATAEDELKKLLDEAFKKQNTEDKEFYKPIYMGILEGSNRVAEAVYGTEGSQNSPWIDYLDAGKVSSWNWTGGDKLKGFAHKFDNGVMTIIGPDPGSKDSAVVSVGDREQWRNFVVDLEFTVDSGNVILLCHLGAQPNASTPSYSFQTEGANAKLKAGKTYDVKVSILGGKFIVRYSGDEPPEPHEGMLDWTYARKGAIGFTVPAGSKIRITRFKVQNLN